MEWKIRECSHGGYVAEYGTKHEGGARVGLMGSTMPAFIVYRAARFDTKRQAEAYARKNPNPMR